jgi:hypothetical protein
LLSALSSSSRSLKFRVSTTNQWNIRFLKVGALEIFGGAFGAVNAWDL